MKSLPVGTQSSREVGDMDAVSASLWPVLQLLTKAFTLQLACGSHITTVSGRTMTNSFGTG